MRCKEYGKNCNWSVRACQRKGTGLWEIRRYTGDHTCLATTVPQNHRQLDVNVICKNIFKIVEGNPTVAIKDLQAAIFHNYRFEPSYRKTWLAKQKAIAQIYGDWDESYNELPQLLLALQAVMPGTSCG